MSVRDLRRVQKWNTMFLTRFSLRDEHLKLRMVVFFKSTEGAGPYSAMLNRHVSTVAQNGQTNRRLWRGLWCFCAFLSSTIRKGEAVGCYVQAHH